MAIKKAPVKVQKMFRYNKPAENGEKAPFIVVYANNPAHAMQVLRDRFNGERINKDLIEEYVPKEKPKKEKKH